MNPSSGVKPPMPIMMMSPRSRELTRTWGSDCARNRSCCNSAPDKSSGLNPMPPCGLTKLLIGETLCCDLGGQNSGTTLGHPGGRGGVPCALCLAIGQEAGTGVYYRDGEGGE